MEKFIVSLGEVIPMWLTVLSGFVMAFALVFWIIPVVVYVARLKNLCAVPNKRTSHENAIPNLGGVAIFIGFIISMMITAGAYFTSELVYVLTAAVILFFIGINDDIMIIQPRKKLTAQILASLIITLFTNLKVVSFFQIFDIGQLTYLPSILVTVLLFLVIINGFNLIDGIDGLASGAGIVSSMFFGVWFWSINDISYASMCFSLAGSLSAFFIYNCFGGKNKIFLGDTGSMLVGLITAVIVMHFLQPDSIGNSNGIFRSVPALVLGVLILPLFDTLRIFTIRISQGKSPFLADRQHIHHRLLELGFTHIQATSIMLTVNSFFIIFCLKFQMIGNISLILIVLAIATIMSYILLRLAKSRTGIKLKNERLLEGIQEKVKPGKIIKLKQIKNIAVSQLEEAHKISK